MQWFAKAGFAVRLYVALGAALFATLLIAGFAVQQVRSVEAALVEAQTVLDHALTPLYDAREALDQTGIAARNAYIFTDDASAQRELAIVDEQKRLYLAELGRLEGPMGQLPAFQKVRDGLQQMARELERPRQYRQAGNMEAYGKFLIDECSPLRRRIVADISALLAELRSRSDQANAVTRANAQSAQRWIVGMSIVCALLSAAIGLVIVRGLMGQLGGEPAYAADVAQAIARGELDREVSVQHAQPDSLLQAMAAMRANLATIVTRVRGGTDAIASASAEIARGNLDLSGRTESQAASISRIAGSMKQLIGAVGRNAEYANQARGISREAAEVSLRGGAAVDGVVTTMGLINESSRKIVDIIGVIDGIAFQTNILALNAAVEAARAGEQGRGFAVVASEVRGLAQRSATAAREIKALIEDTVERVEGGAAAVGEAGGRMKEVVERIQRVTHIMEEISAATAAQNREIAEVNEAVVAIDDMTLQNAALVEEAAAAAQALRDQADELAQVVGTFRLAPVQALDVRQALLT